MIEFLGVRVLGHEQGREDQRVIGVEAGGGEWQGARDTYRKTSVCQKFPRRFATRKYKHLLGFSYGAFYAMLTKAP